MGAAAGSPVERPAAAGGRPAPRRLRPALSLALVIASLALLFAPGLAAHVRKSADPWRFNDDARQQIWPLLGDADPALFRGDYVADYYLANLPRGYRALYRLGGLVADPRTVSKVLPYVQLAVVVGALTAASWALAGPGAAWGTGALCLSSDLYLGRMGGGLPRSFAFPLVAVAVLALVRGAPRVLCALPVVAAGLYYPVAILLAGTATAYLLLLPAGWRGTARAWPLRRRVGILAATAAGLALLALPALLAGRQYGPRLGTADVEAFPEAGPGGRYEADDLPSPGRFLDQMSTSLVLPLVSFGRPWYAPLNAWARRAAQRDSLQVLAGAAVAAAGALLLLARPGARRLLALVAAAVASYGLALALWPYLFIPRRYLLYSVTLLTPVVVPAAIVAVAERWRISRAAAGPIAVAAIAALVLAFGGRDPRSHGLMGPVPESWRPVYDVLARLPPDALIAGWPDGPIENVPYLSRRRILVGYEIHQAFHRGYAAEMRRRMTALIEAYFAADLAPLSRLRRDFGVTHLLVDRTHYGARPPEYFKPFDAMIADAARAAPPQPVPLRLAPGAVFETGSLILLDLGRLPASPDSSSASGSPSTSTP